MAVEAGRVVERAAPGARSACARARAGAPPTAAMPIRSSAVAELTGSSSWRLLTSTSSMPASSSASWSAMVAPGGRRDDAVHLPGAHRLRVEQLPLRVVVGVGGERRVAGRHEAVLDPAQDRREERVGQIRDQHADRVRAVRLQPARDRVGPIAELLGGLEDAPRGLLVDERARFLVERAGYRCRVDAGHARDVPQGHRPRPLSRWEPPSTSIMHSFAAVFERLTDTALSSKEPARRGIGPGAASPPGFRAAGPRCAARSS